MNQSIDPKRRRVKASSLRRRTLLASGVGMLAAPLLRSQESHAQAAQKARFIAMAHPIGQMEDWLPTGGVTDFELTEQTQSLAPFRDRLIFVRGLRSALTEGDNGMGGHGRGLQAAFTGRRPVDGPGRPESINISVDQEIAQRLGADSLALGALPGGEFNDVLSHKEGGDPIFAEGNAVKVFDLLFAGLGGDEVEQQKLRLRRQSMFDAWSTELTDLKGQLGVQHQQHLDAHLTEIRGLEQDLAGVVNSCEAPELDLQATDFYTKSANYQAIGTQMMDLIVAALACDRAQVASLVWQKGGATNQTYPWLDSTKGHHVLTHDQDVAGANEQLRRIYGWYTEQFAYLLQKLSDVPDGDATLLDNTLLFWGTSLGAHRSHSGRDMRVLVAGNANGYFRTGQYLQFPRTGALSTNRPLNDLLTEIVRGVTGEETDKFHVDDLNTQNELPEIRA